MLHKQRKSGTETAITHVVGDVRSRACLIIDDMISTGGTIAESIEVLLHVDARPELWIVATHGLLLDGAREKLGNPAVQEVFITATAGHLRGTADRDRAEEDSLRRLVQRALSHCGQRKPLRQASLKGLRGGNTQAPLTPL